MTDKDSPNQPIPEPRTITLPRKDFQPSKSDMEREYDMPGLSLDEIRSNIFSAFQHPVRGFRMRSNVTFRYNPLNLT